MTDHLTYKSKTTHEFLHRLWTKAVGTPGYDKEEWKRLEALIGYEQQPPANPFMHGVGVTRVRYPREP